VLSLNFPGTITPTGIGFSLGSSIDQGALNPPFQTEFSKIVLVSGSGNTPQKNQLFHHNYSNSTAVCMFFTVSQSGFFHFVSDIFDIVIEIS